ncbi:hypothetical protein V6N13_092457 [Hibiscus sabdariffa]
MLYCEDLLSVFGRNELVLSKPVSETGKEKETKTFVDNIVGRNNHELINKSVVVDGKTEIEDTSVPPKIETKTRPKPPFAIGETVEGCDIFSGRWVRDELNRPHYEESECPYIQPQLTCQEHGRPDREYQKWRWQPHGCDIPSVLFLVLDLQMFANCPVLVVFSFRPSPHENEME